MPIEITEKAAGKVIHVQVTGKLDQEDYARFTPEVERLIKLHDTVRFLLETHDFHGWDASALWEDIKFDAKHFNDIERLAVVGEKKWEEGMTKFCKPFTSAEIRFFEPHQLAEATTWVEEGMPG